MNYNREAQLDWFTKDNLRPIERTGYPSYTKERIFMADRNDNRYLADVQPNIVSTMLVIEGWLKANNLFDNKIVIRCRCLDGGGDVYLSFYDGNFSIGADVHAIDGQLPKDISDIPFHE